jgi:hypothetical protein
MAKANGKAGTIRIGSRVTYDLPWGTLNAVVVEDRGIRGGLKGRRVMSIRPIFEGIEDTMDEWEVPLEKLKLAE